MITKYDLRRYREIKAEVQNIENQITEIQRVMTAPRIPVMTGLPGSHGEPDKLGNMVAKAVDLQNMYCEKMSFLLDLQAEIETEIDKLAEGKRRLIRLYYFDGLTWEAVACELGVTWRHVHRIHREILETLAEK